MNQVTTPQPTEANNATTRVLVVSAGCTNGYIHLRPWYCAIQISKPFIERVEALIALCVEHDLERVSVSHGPEMWGPAGIEEESRLHQAELFVCKSGQFWFSDTPRDKPYFFESKSLTLSMVQEYLAQSQEEVVFQSEQIQECYEDDH